MEDQTISSLERIGYRKNIPKGEDIDSYETIFVKNKLGKAIKLYRHINQKKQDDLINFNSSWELYNKLI